MFRKSERRLRFGGILAGSLLLGCAGFAEAAGIRVEAVPGSPFGVGRAIVPLDGILDRESLETRYFSVSDRDGRVHYPAVRYTRPMGLIRELFDIPVEAIPSQLQIHFLFTGAQPLHLTLHTPQAHSITVVPHGKQPAYRRLLRTWWVRYKAATRKQRLEGDYSPVMETYLTTMLARRLGLVDTTRMERFDDAESLSILLGTEPARLAMLRDSVDGLTRRDDPLDLELPEAIDWPAPSAAILEEGVGVEEMARHVPRECFYVRFAQFPNYSWLRRLLEEYGGDLSRMVLLRGTDSQLNRRVENQLGLRESSLSRMLGPQVISDIAMIGRDTFLQEGAAIGVLFEAKSELLQPELERQRNQRLTELQHAGATVETIKIEGREVSFASSPDNQFRSFYVVDGKYHLVTNCREIAKRFVQCGRGIDALGDSDEFRYARSLIPVGEDNTVFAYLSRGFFEGLLSPQYQVEVNRRLQSVADMELMELATRAAVAEGYGDEPISAERLVDLGFLGSRVDQRSDGSFMKVENGEVVDSLRGHRGTFLPIPDVSIHGVSASEERRFRRTVDFHSLRWQRMDPVLIGLRRSMLDDDTERVEIDARMLPLNREKYGLLTEVFGAPTSRRIRTLPDDIVSIQAFVDGGNLAVAPHHLYFGIRNTAPRSEYSERRFLKSLQIMRTAPAYLAAWPSPGFLDTIGLHGRPIGDGYRKMLLGLLRFDAPNGFTLLSFDQRILSEVAPLMETETIDDPAQLHVHFGDIKNSPFGTWANDLDFQRAWETSVGNVHLLHAVSQQLQVPIEQAKEAAERILNARLLCTLGGEYELHQDPDGTQRWVSTAWHDGKQQSRDAYVSPLMTWLRGFDAAVTIEEDRVVATAALDIERAKTDSSVKLPIFDFFGTGQSKRAD